MVFLNSEKETRFPPCPACLTLSRVVFYQDILQELRSLRGFGSEVVAFCGHFYGFGIVSGGTVYRQREGHMHGGERDGWAGREGEVARCARISERFNLPCVLPCSSRGETC